MRGGNLTAALVVIGIAELALHRVASRLFLPQAGVGRSFLQRVVVDAAPFLFHLTAVLGIVVLVGGAVGAARRRELFLPAIRVTLAVIGAVFVGLAGWGTVMAGLPARFALHMQMSYAFLSLLVAASVLRASAPLRVKLGVGLLTLPGVIFAVTLFVDRMGFWRDGALWLARLGQGGQLVAFAAAALSPLLLPPTPFGAARLAPGLAAGALASGLVLFAMSSSFDVVQSVALYGLRLDLDGPPGPSTLFAVFAVFGLCLGAWQLLAERGPPRLMGLGLLAMATAGYQLSTPPELCLALAGVLALSLGVTRAWPPRPGPEPVPEATWRTYVSRLAAALADPPAHPSDPRNVEAVVVHDDDIEITRIRCIHRARPLSVRVRRRAGIVLEAELVIGDPGHGEPDASIELAGASGETGAAAGLPPALTGDADFDRRFLVLGNPPLEDEGLRLKLIQWLGGSVVLWNGRAARFRRAHGEDGPDIFAAPLDLAALLDLVAAIDALLGSVPPEVA